MARRTSSHRTGKPKDEAFQSFTRTPVDRGVPIVALVGHFCVQREQFGGM